MLELRPNCEHCNKALPPHSLEACICSFKRACCATCVDNLFINVCPNCGGGFVPRPIRPVNNWKNEDYLGKFPASKRNKGIRLHQAVQKHGRTKLPNLIDSVVA